MIKRFYQHLFFVSISIIILSACKQRKKQTAMELVNTMPAKLFSVQPSATSSPNDFDFLVGKWSVHNRRLTTKQDGSKEWIEFESELHMRKTINGLGNVENYYATFNDKPFEGQAVRLFNPATKLWTVYWMDSNNPMMDEHPVTGSFENKIGKLYANDTFNGKPVVVLYQWDATDPLHPRWSQASSQNNGKTWEWNWEMVLTRITES
jgi:hypothetical protein